MYFISAAVILLASLVLIVQVSLPYNKTGRAIVLYRTGDINNIIYRVSQEGCAKLRESVP